MTYKEIDQNFNFIEMEHKWLKHWYDDGIVAKYLAKNAQADKHFTFIDGPITANNYMGVHHAWGRSYKDLWQKFHNLLGYKQRFQNGFDCQGLWVEVEVEKELGLHNKKDIENLVPGDRKASIAKFVQLCKDRVNKFSGIQTEQTKRLGNFMNWENSYYTMSPENNYMIWHFLKVCYENDWIYKGHESVPWCPRCETAISQHEMLTEDYKEVVHESVFIRFPIVDHKDEFLLVWTTTPWTIPANIAVAVDEKLDYSLVKAEDGKSYWVVKEQVEKLFAKTGTVVKTVKGSELVGLKYKGPFDHLEAAQKVAKEKLFHTVIATDENILPISTEEGTGLVHTAVSAGSEDFHLGRKYGLPMIPVIEDNADYMPGLGEFTGKNAKKHPELIIDFMKSYEDGQYLFSTLRYKHRYPACWRCKTELVWKVADEWYIAMDRPTLKGDDKRTLRERMKSVAQKIHWMPEFGLDRELDWLDKMHDWLISKKNRYWGLALPIYECPKCHTFEVLGGYDELKERAVEGWDQFEGHTPHKPYIDEVKIKCSKCNTVVSRLNDVGNVWLDAGIVPYSTLVDPKTGKVSYITDKKYFEEWFPADFITESFPGQFKNWFYSMIAMSTVLENTNPFKNVLGFATMLGEDGRAMHKSWGNYIEFNEGADKIGVDVMRWMFARQNPTDNMLFGYKRADEVRRQFYLLLWNTYKYYVEYANLEKVKPTDHKKQPESSNVLDIWILTRFNWLIEDVKENLKKFNPKDSAIAMEEFVDDLSTWYIRRSRNRVWVHADSEEDKMGFYHTMHYVLSNLAIMMSPIMPAVTEEIYTELTGEESVHLAFWPEAEEYKDTSVIADMQIVRDIVEVGHRIRKEQKLKVRQVLKAVTITLSKNLAFKEKKYSEQYIKLLSDELNVKDVNIIDGDYTEILVEYDTSMTPELQAEGELRELIRTIQAERKNLGLKLNQSVNLVVPEKFAKSVDEIKKAVYANSITTGAELKVEK